jgi:DNA polymerase-3 subunit delta'
VAARQVEKMGIAEAVACQPRATMALEAALESGASHAYLFRGPRGSGKGELARAFAAELLAGATEDGEEARRRALMDPSPHPDLVWLRPTGAQHMVEEVRERVIRASAYRPFEGGKRVFVVEAAEAMRDESQNALLKTLEEPPGFVHLILLSSEPAALLETIVSRCQPVDFAPLPAEAVEEALREGGGISAGDEEVKAAARLSAGDVELARLLLTEQGRQARAQAEAFAAFALGGSEGRGGEGAGAGTAPAPWKALLDVAEKAGEEAEAVAREALEAEKEAGLKRSARDIADEAKRTGRRRRTELLDLGLRLLATWYRDLAATAAGAPDLAHNSDRLADLEAAAARLSQVAPRSGAQSPAVSAARQAAELVQDTRRRLDLNVSEELALEALSFRLTQALDH